MNPYKRPLRYTFRTRRTLWTINLFLALACTFLLVDNLSSHTKDDGRTGPRGELVLREKERVERVVPLRKREDHLQADDDDEQEEEEEEVYTRQKKSPRLGSGVPTSSTSSNSNSRTPTSRNPGDKYCTPEEYASGFWRERAHRPSDMDELRLLNSLTSTSSTKCHPLSYPVEDHGEPDLSNTDHLARILHEAQWEWVPLRNSSAPNGSNGATGADGADGAKGAGKGRGKTCRRKELGEGAFVKRLLRSRGGLVLAGDSLTEQHYRVIQNLLLYPSSPFISTSEGDRPRKETILLDPNHPLTPGILRNAGVHPSRAARPVVTFFLERHLISREEMDRVMLPHPVGYKSFASGEGLVDWVSESIWFEGYEQAMKHRVRFTEDDVEEEDTVLVLNSGPHWVNYEFTLDPVDFYQELLSGWGKTIELLQSKLSSIPRSRQSVFWRATAPGHPHCEFSSSAENRTDFRSTTDPSFMRYNWDLFERLNDAWKSQVARGESTIRYLDTWGMSVQRPDSHLLPPNDCLHYCYGMGGVVEEWHKFLWHTIALQSVNDDYHVDRPAWQ